MSWLRNSLSTCFYWPVKWLVRSKSVPADVESELGVDRNKPIVYLLQTDSVTDQLALSFVCKKLGLPEPDGHLENDNIRLPRCLYLRRPQPVLKRPVKQTDAIDVFTNMFHLHRVHEDLDFQVLPVYITWGRAPGRGESGWADLIADRASPSWLRKFFIVLFLCSFVWLS